MVGDHGCNHNGNSELPDTPVRRPEIANVWCLLTLYFKLENFIEISKVMME